MFEPISKPKISTANSGSSLFFKPMIQTKLSVNESGDVYEREADSVADKVMHMNDVNGASFFSASTIVQRKCAACEEEEKKMQMKSAVSIQRKCAHCEEEEKLQRKENADGAKVSAQTENYVNNLSGGKNLGKEERNFFESRMGYDFSNVKIHTDSAANESAKNINAVAYTHGNNIVFGSGTYQPNTDEGKKLMAHELAHVVQQNNGLQRKIIQRTSTAPAVVWGFEVWRNMCGCVPAIEARISEANDFSSVYAGCDTAANADADAVENCFDTARPGTTVVASTAAGGAVAGPAPAATPCERIDNHATLVHEHFHTTQADSYARRVGGAFYTDWRALAGSPAIRLSVLAARYPADHTRFLALWNNGHEWSAGEVESYTWERRFLVDVKNALKSFC